MKGYIPPQNEEERFFWGRVQDAAVRCERTGRSVFMGFWDERQQALANAALSAFQNLQVSFWGGFAQAERKMLGLAAAPESIASQDYPIVSLRVQCQKNGTALTHRDYLGALLGLGLERRCVGDILVDEQGAWLLVLESHAQFICDELISVGKASVTACPAQLDLTAAENAGSSLIATVASLRLDAVLSAAMRQSRQNAASFIRSGKVQVCHLTVTQPAAQLEEGDTLTVRGVGKFRLEKAGGQSRKGRLFVTIRKF